jgi:squalene-associated FAD-dependent desaturase
MSGRVVVVGGGLAGLSAAVDLADAGVPVTLLERRPRLGGATHSFRRAGLRIDNGQHVFLRCCTAYRGFLDRLGVSVHAPLQRRLSVPVLAPGGRRADLARTSLPAPLHLAGAVARYRHLPVADRLRVARAAFALRRSPASDDVTFADWLRAHGQSDRAVEAFWDLITVPTVNLPSAQASLALAATVFQLGLLTETAAGDIGVPAIPLSDLHAAPAHRLLGESVRTGVAVRAVEPSGGRFLLRTTDEVLTADAVVVAVPHDDVAALLPAGLLPDPAALGASPILNVHVIYDRPVTDLPFAAAVDSPVQWVFDRTVTSGLTSGQYLALSISAADDLIDQPVADLARTYTAALADLFPAARGARVRELFVTRERTATFRGVPGTLALRARTTTPVPGLLLAGAWTDTGWPATMEGAVRSGRAAAAAALAHLSAPHPAEVTA